MLQSYFAFADGVLAYDCPRCGQACCRGKGVAIDAQRELVPLLRRRPQLAPFLAPLASGYVKLPDVTDGCWFLQKDGLCEYEATFGREAKFTTCRLFPFNRVFLVGTVRVIDVNSVVCPLYDATGTGNGVSHAYLLAELAALGSGPLTSSAVEPPATARELRWHVLEQAILEASSGADRAAAYLPFAVEQERLTRKQLGQGEPGAGQADRLQALVTLWTDLFGRPAQQETPPAAAQAMRLLSASLRFNALFRKSSTGFAEQLRRLPGRLLAAAFLLEHAEALHAPSASLRSATELFQAQGELCALMGQLDQPALLTRALPTENLPPEVGQVLGAVNRKLVSTHPQRLGALLTTLAGDLPPEHRSLLCAGLLRAGDALRFSSEKTV